MSGALNSKHLLSLDGLQAIMRAIAISCSLYTVPNLSSKSLSGSSDKKSLDVATFHKTWFHLLDYNITVDFEERWFDLLKEHTHIETLREMKKAKELLTVGIDRFNVKPKDGIGFMQGNQLFITIHLPQRMVFYLNLLMLPSLLNFFEIPHVLIRPF